MGSKAVTALHLPGSIVLLYVPREGAPQRWLVVADIVHFRVEFLLQNPSRVQNGHDKRTTEAVSSRTARQFAGGCILKRVHVLMVSLV